MPQDNTTTYTPGGSFNFKRLNWEGKVKLSYTWGHKQFTYFVEPAAWEELIASIGFEGKTSKALDIACALHRGS